MTSDFCLAVWCSWFFSNLFCTSELPILTRFLHSWFIMYTLDMRYYLALLGEGDPMIFCEPSLSSELAVLLLRHRYTSIAWTGFLIVYVIAVLVIEHDRVICCLTFDVVGIDIQILELALWSFQLRITGVFFVRLLPWFVILLAFVINKVATVFNVSFPTK